MALIALASGKGSPGVSTTALALAAVWPRRALLAECDPAGGDLAYRQAADHGGPLDPNRGMLSLAAAARRGLTPGQVMEHSQRLSGGLDALVGLAVAEQAAGWTGQWPVLGRALAGLADADGIDVIADCGRIGPDSPALDLLPHASLVLLVSGSRPEQIGRTRDRAAALAARLHGTSPGSLATPPIGVLLIVEPGRRKSLGSQVEDVLAGSGLPVRLLGAIADDPSGAEQLAGRRRGRVGRSLLVRSAREVARTLRSRYGVGTGPLPAAPARAGVPAPEPAPPAPAPAPAPYAAQVPQTPQTPPPAYVPQEAYRAPEPAAPPAVAQPAPNGVTLPSGFRTGPVSATRPREPEVR